MANDALERIQVELRAMTKKFTSSMDRARASTKKMGLELRVFGKVMTMPIDSFSRMGNRLKTVNSQGVRFARGLRVLTHGMRGFRMEMLGVMFFGMMLRNMFVQLLNPVLEAFGIFDLFREMLLILFIPIMEDLFEPMMDIMNWFINLPDDTKKVIGIFTILMIITGALLQTFGSLALGIGSVILAFEFITASLVLTFFLALSGAILFTVGVVQLANDKWEGLGLMIMGMGVILAIFIGWWALIPIAIGAAVYLIVKHWDDIKIAFTKGLLWITDKLDTFFTWLAKIPGGVGDFFQGVSDKISIWTDELNYNLEALEMEKIAQEIIAAGEEAEKGITSSFGDMSLTFEKKGNEMTQSVEDMTRDVESLMSNSMIDIDKEVEEGMGDMVHTMETSMALFSSGYQGELDSNLLATTSFVDSVGKQMSKLGKGSAYLMSAGSSAFAQVGSGYKKYNDFIWRPGSSPVSMHPDDTIVGFKGAAPDLSGGSGGVTINQNLNITAMNERDIVRLISVENDKLVNKLQRNIG